MTTEKSLWLTYEGDSRYSIGGRDTDVYQIAYNLERSTKAAFPLNQVPAAIADRLKKLFELLHQAEAEIQEYITLVQNTLDE